MKKLVFASLICVPFAQAMDAPLQSEGKGKIQTLTDLPTELQLHTIYQAGSPTELAGLMQNLRKANRHLKNLVETNASFIINSFAQNNNKNPMRVKSQIPPQCLSAVTQHKIQEWRQKGQALIHLIFQCNQYDPEVALSDLKNQLNEGADINYQTNNGSTALILAAANGHHQIAQALLDGNAKPDYQTNNGSTALILAALNGYHQIAQALLERGAKPDLQDKHGWTALMCVVANGHHQISQALLKGNAKPDLQNKDGCTALIYAARHGHHQIAQALLKSGAKPDLQNKHGWTALKYAAQNGHHQVAQALLDHNADPTIRTKHGKTALDYAREKGFEDIVAILELETMELL